MRLSEGRTSKKYWSGEAVFFLYDADEFVRFLQALADVGVIVGKLHLVHPLLAEGAQAFLFQHVADLVESYFLFKVLGICHDCFQFSSIVMQR